MLDNVVKVLSIMYDYKGTTTVEVMNKITGEIFTGVARCNPQDSFNGWVGFEIGYFRAFQSMLDTAIKDYCMGYKYLHELKNELNK